VVITHGSFTATARCVAAVPANETKLDITSTSASWGTSESGSGLAAGAIEVLDVSGDLEVNEMVATETSGSFLWVYITAVPTSFGPDCAVFGYYLTN
jgi:hypothetical protein